MGIGKEIFELCDKIKYTFADITLLERALTHSSYTNEMKAKGIRALSNESLEFLGDAVLQIVISEELYDKYSTLGEGTLTRMRQHLVCESSLARIARSINLGDYLNVGTGEETSRLRERDKVLADAAEALIAAIYKDAELSSNGNYKRVILDLFSNELLEIENNSSSDYKTMLQQFVEKNPDSVLRYEYEETGPEHNKRFAATAYINNNRVGTGTGKTKRAAEMQAAKSALRLFGIIR